MQKQVLISLSVDELKALMREVRDEPQHVKAEPAKEPEEMMTITEVCKLLMISPPTLRRLVRDNELCQYRLGKSSVIRLKRSEVNAALKNIRYLKHARKPL